MAMTSINQLAVGYGGENMQTMMKSLMLVGHKYSNKLQYQKARV